MPFKILSLDGGGVRGAFIAGFLAETERLLGQSLVKRFDLLAGTSTGAIIAAGLAAGLSAEDIEHFYRERAPSIFIRRPAGSRVKVLNFIVRMLGCGPRIDAGALLGPKYDAIRLRGVLDEVFGQKTLAEMTTRLVIPAVDVSRGRNVVFKTPHLRSLVRDRDLRVTDVLLPTAAAPTFFPHAVIRKGKCLL